MNEIKPIGYHKYSFLKTLKVLTEDEKRQMKEYEESITGGGVDPEFYLEYMRKLNAEPEELQIKLTPEQCYNLFIENWDKVNTRNLILHPEMIENLKFMNRYFGRESFDPFCEPLSTPTYKKGILLVGGFGNAKTTAMRTYRKAFETLKGYSFKYFTAKQVSEMYEDCKDSSDKTSFWKNVISGVAHFDDVLNEDISSNYGKKDIMKDVLEKRYDAGLKTHMTINTRKHGDVNDAIEQIAERYGERLYDRIFEMFNIYHWKGKSMRL